MSEPVPHEDPEHLDDPEHAGSWLGDSTQGDSMYDLQWRPGEDAAVPADDPAAVAAARRFRDVLGRFASGITVVTGLDRGVPVGLTCQSFSSVSLVPPLVLVVPSATSRAWPLIRRSGGFCVNVLAEDQRGVSQAMAGRADDKFAGVGWAPTPVTGSPRLDGALAWLDCEVHAVHEAGDHYVVIGRVRELGEGVDARPLLYFRGGYRTTDG